MKKFYLTILTALLFAIPALANTVYVQGTVKNSNGTPLANRQVKIQADSSGCQVIRITYTNPNGFYSDTLNCTTNIAFVRTSTENCNGTMLINMHPVSNNNSVVSDFTVCVPAQCQAYFTYSIGANGNVQFTNTSSGAGISYTSAWSFGDGSNSTQQNPSHTYTSNGTYTVRLAITAGNCMDSIVKVVTINNIGTTTCQSIFSYIVSNANPLKIEVNSANSHGVSPSDSIIQRTWYWGDSTTTTGNLISTTHTYASAGTYQVCLKIKTASGCEKTECKQVTVSAPNTTTCASNFAVWVLQSVNPLKVETSSANSHGITPSDSIIQRIWTWGDGTTTSGNLVAPTHTYTNFGTYQVCLKIKTAAGCEKTECKSITLLAPYNCEAVFSVSGIPSNSSGYSVQFNSNNSHGVNASDSVIERKWNWGDGSSTGGNIISPIHTFSSQGSYNVCLVIKSASGCRDTVCKTVVVPMQNQVVCKAKFTYEQAPGSTPISRAIKFNSISSTHNTGDSIISRKWVFGDSSNALLGNVVAPVHVYPSAGTYNVCLTITTASGCVSTECKVVVVPQVQFNCTPHFTSQRVGPKKVAFNSATSWVPLNDTIVQRKWNFGDNTPVLTGNVIAPIKEYANYGVYTVSLRIITARGCEQTFTQLVNVQDSITNPINDPIKILSLYPNPVSTNMSTVVWSQHNNITAELAVYDIYGTKKWSINKTLLQGNNITIVPVQQLVSGPYYFRVTTMYGVRSKPFYKL